tara:strand:- start:79 stop:648 length:570 start_codon:yes stop_codon:yes gene_type:complete
MAEEDKLVEEQKQETDLEVKPETQEMSLSEEKPVKKIIEPEEKIPQSNKKIAVILVRGLVKVKKTVKDTLAMLRLTRKNHCVVIDNNPVNMGMIKKAKDYITWGEIDSETYTELINKRGQSYEGPETCSKGKIKYNKFFVHEGKKLKKYFRLNPPKKGFGRKGIKIPFKVGGGLGYRGEKINELIKNML